MTSRGLHSARRQAWLFVLPMVLAGCSLVDALGDSGEGADGSVGSPVDATPLGPGCVGLAGTCGPAGNDNCCAHQLVAGGMYYRSYDLATDDHNDTSYPAMVSDFRLDTYEVTVGRFRAFVEAGKGTRVQPPDDGAGEHLAIPQSGWSTSWNADLEANQATLIEALACDPTYQTWTDTPGANEHLPINCVTWYEAMAFCIWDGGYLPTEAEWNYAAAGGDQQRAYPWSSPASSTTINSTNAVYFSTSAASVGSKPLGNGRWGHADLAGNVWEWTLDYSGSYASPCTDCANLTPTGPRVYRGGSFYNGVSQLRSAYRSGNPPTQRNYQVGVRCARKP